MHNQIQPIKIGILGLGTVGAGTVKILQRNAGIITRRSGKSITVVQAAVRDLVLKRDCNMENIALTTDVLAVVNNPELDLIIELINGTTLALQAVTTAIKNGKHIVTANKALIALHGNQLLALAEKHNVSIAFEATVAGGIPVVKAIREGLTANKILWLAGIINGTSNFILSEMAEKNRDFAVVLKQAQDLGFAESDPTFDIEGIDAGHKLTILASIAFGIPLQFDKVYTEGISNIVSEDVDYAAELGYHIKHLGIAKQTESGIELRVHPTLIPKTQLLANVNGVMNAVLAMGDAVGTTLYYGAGAGAEATASAVIADITDIVRTMDIANINKVPSLSFQSNQIENTNILAISQISSSYYIKTMVNDESGVLAKIVTILADNQISVEAFIQKDCVNNSQIATLVILTHVVLEQDINNAINAINALDVVKSAITKIRMERLS